MAITFLIILRQIFLFHLIEFRAFYRFYLFLADNLPKQQYISFLSNLFNLMSNKKSYKLE
jgi:hypothetical protein